jgi:transcription-repair coupling factor (superfamily II helicase)
MDHTPPAPAWLDAMASDETVAALARALDARRRAVVTGAVGASTALLAGVLARRLERPALLVVAHIDESDDALEELATLGLAALRLPALEVLPGETDIALDLFAERLAVQREVMRLAEGPSGTPPVLIAPIQALMQGVPRPERLGDLARTIDAGDRANLTDLAAWLTQAGYTRMDAVEEPGDFAVRGGILDVFPPGGFGRPPVRLDFFGDEVERINEIDLETMGSDRRIDSVELIAARTDVLRSDAGTLPFLELVPPDAAALLAETLEVVEQGRGYFERATDARGLIGPPEVLRSLESRFRGFAEVNRFSAGASGADERIELPVSPLPEFSRDLRQAVGELVDLAGEVAVTVVCQKEAEATRLGELLTEQAGAPEAEGGGGIRRGGNGREGNRQEGGLPSCTCRRADRPGAEVHRRRSRARRR